MVCRLFFYNRVKNRFYFADSVLFISLLAPYNKGIELEVNVMTAKERILALRLLEKQERSPEYAKRIGIQVKISQKDPNNKEEKHV